MQHSLVWYFKINLMEYQIIHYQNKLNLKCKVYCEATTYRMIYHIYLKNQYYNLNTLALITLIEFEMQ